MFQLILFAFVLLMKWTSVCPVVISDGVYGGLTIGLSPSLDSGDCQSIVTSIQTMLERASATLEDSEAGLTFGSVSVIVPDSWANCGSFSLNDAGGYMTFEGSDVRVGDQHPVFGNEPWTLQPRGCGQEGQFISIPSQWLQSSGTSDQQKGSRFVHEWAKYRWGVFEEYGHFEDPIFPESSRDDDGYWEPNYCTDDTLQGGFTSACSSSSDCQFVIEESPAVTSSILAVPQLSSVNRFCTESNHRKDIPSKHNLLCNHLSTWDVMQRHSDFSNATRKGNRVVSRAVDIRVLRSNLLHTVVIAYETTKMMTSITNRMEFETESLAQFILYESPSTSQLGLVSFSSSAIIQSNLQRLDDLTLRETLAEKILDTQFDTTNKTPNIESAIKTAAEMLTDANGIILLVAKCTDEEISYSPESLATAAGGNPVWAFLYPFSSTKYFSIFSDLTDMTGGRIITIQEELVTEGSDTYVSPMTRMRLSQSVRQLLHEDPSVDIQQVAYGTCEGNVEKCSKTLTVPAGFEYPTYINIYHDIGDQINYPESTVSVDGGECPLSGEEIFNNVQTTQVIRCTLSEDGSTIDITVTRKRKIAILVIEVVGRPTVEDTEFNLQVFGSSNLLNLQYTSDTAPAIYVQIGNNVTSVVFASIYVEVNFDTIRSSYDPFNLTDDGTGADITGNDGIYSGFFVPAIPVGDFSISIYADDNNKEAKFLPTTYDKDTYYRCCGSVIPLPDSLEETGPFTLSKVNVSATISSSPNNLNLPPGSVRDLAVADQGSNSFTVSFTATGEDFTYGTVNYYLVRLYGSDLNNYTEEKTSFRPKSAGQTETFTVSDVPCERRHVTSIVAVDGSKLEGQESNRVSVYLYCSNVTEEKLGAGAIAGIVLICLVLIIALILLVLYFCCRDKMKDQRRKPLKLKGCSCCSKTDDKRKYSDKSPSNYSDNFNRSPVQRIRNINDLVVNQADDQTQTKVPHSKESSIEDLGCMDGEIPHSGVNNHLKTEDYLSNSLTFSAQFKTFGSEKSLQSARTTSPFASAYSINHVGIPMNNTPSSSYSDYKTIPAVDGGSVESFTPEPPPVPPRKVLYNTQV